MSGMTRTRRGPRGIAPVGPGRLARPGGVYGREVERSAEGAGALMVGTGVVSTVTTPAGEGPLVLPAASAAVAENGWGPSARSELGVKVQLPFESAVAVPATAPSILTLTVAPGSAVPLNGGRNCGGTGPSAGARVVGAA